MKVVLKNVRASFVQVFNAKSFNDQDAKYSLQVILPKNHPGIKDLKAAILDAAKDKWSDKIKGDKMPGNLKNPLRDGDEEREEREEYEGQYFFNCSSKRRPQVFNRDMTPLTEDDGVLYSGCFINVSINTYPFDVSGNKGVAVGLNGLQFCGDGEALGGSFDSTDDFDSEDGEVEELDVSDDDLL